jgi:hypothetical protein
LRAFVANRIRGPLDTPEFGIGCGHDPTVTAFVHMPETAVNLDDFLPACQNNVWLSRQVFPMTAVTESHPVHEGAHYPLGGGIFAFDRRHVSAALFFGMYVGHLLDSSLLFQHEFDKTTH